MKTVLNNILKSEKLPEIRSGQAEITTESLADMNAVRQALEAFNASQGWVCFSDEICAYRSTITAADLTGRIILSAELVRGECSLHLRQDGAGWQCWSIDAKAEGDCWVIDETLIGTPGLKGRLHYETYWGQSEVNAAYAPLFSRFAGFDKGGE